MTDILKLFIPFIAENGYLFIVITLLIITVYVIHNALRELFEIVFSEYRE